MSLNGIDISAWQSGIDCGKVSADFIITKVTEGTAYVSGYADSQIQATLNAGKLMGFYHFASGMGANAEADYFIEHSSGYFKKGIPVLDFEINIINPVSWCKTWLDRVFSKTGVRPLIYMSKSVAQTYDWTTVAEDYGLWGAMYPDNSSTGYYTPSDSGNWGAWGSDLTIRQYTSNGVVSGYSGSLDLNIAYLDKTGWSKIAGATSSTVTKILTGDEDDMTCYFEVSGAGWPMMYFDGRTIKAMDGNEFAVVKKLYKTANGKDMPGLKLTKAEYKELKELTERAVSAYK